MIQTLQELEAGGYKNATKIKLAAGLESFPPQILECENLEILDLSGNNLTELPEEFCRLSALKIAFFSDNQFKTFPPVLSKCSKLEMVAFKNNGMTTIPESSLSTNLRWLILTNNRIQSLPKDIGQCQRLQKLMLAGNCLTTLPDSMAKLCNLGLLRLSSNQFTALPQWLFKLPSLSWLAFAGNPCAPAVENTQTTLPDIPFSSLAIQHILGEGASGLISQASWTPSASATPREVAVKIYKGAITSDGSPYDELSACILADVHPNLINPLGVISSHPSHKLGLVLQLVPPTYKNLGNPPNMITCTRDTYPDSLFYSMDTVLSILRGISSVAKHLHAKSISHGDLYAHNILLNDEGHALLGDFGAATCYQHVSGVSKEAVERLEVRAFGCLLDDLVTRVNRTSEPVEHVINRLEQLREDCWSEDVESRPLFAEICEVLA